MVSNTQAPAHFYLYLNGEGSWVVAPSLATLPGREILSQDSKVGMVFLIDLAVICILYATVFELVLYSTSHLYCFT